VRIKYIQDGLAMELRDAKREEQRLAQKENVNETEVEIAGLVVESYQRYMDGLQATNIGALR
jgi:hypothetical protein